MRSLRPALRVGLAFASGALPLPATIDRNSDGVSDLWSDAHPSAGSPAADPDGDGASNLAESLAGTDPLASSSRFAAAPQAEADGSLSLHWAGVAGKRYQVETSPDLLTWNVDASLGALAGAGVELRPTVRPAGAPTTQPQFWRVAVSDTDSDSDGLNNWEEAQLGTSPTIADTDSDGLTDGWEVTNGHNPKVASFTEVAPDTLFKLINATVDVAGTPKPHYYHFRAPAAYNADRTVSYPLIVSLHWYGVSNDPANLRDGETAAPWYVKDLTLATSEHPAFVYAPLCPLPYTASSNQSAQSGGQWNSPEAKAMIVATIRDLCSRYNIDRRRISITGFSMGGSGSFYIAHAFHEATGSRFAAVCRGAGASPSVAEFPEIHASLALSPVWFHVGGDDTGPRALAAEGYAHLRGVHLAQGGTETIGVRTPGDGLTVATGWIDYWNPANLVSDFSEVSLAGNPVARLSIYRDYPHVDHMFRNADLFPWLFSQAIPPAEILR